jgi:hypothetical protein
MLVPIRKVKFINDARVTPKLTQKFLSSKYVIGTNTVSDILKKKADVLLGQYENNADGKKKRFDNACKFDELNKLTWDWFQKARATSYPITLGQTR